MVRYAEHGVVERRRVFTHEGVGLMPSSTSLIDSNCVDLHRNDEVEFPIRNSRASEGKFATAPTHHGNLGSSKGREPKVLPATRYQNGGPEITTTDVITRIKTL